MNLFYRAIRNKNFWCLKSADTSPDDVTDTLLPQAVLLKAGSWCCYTAAFEKSCASESASQHNCKWEDRRRCRYLECLPVWHFLPAKWTTV